MDKILIPPIKIQGIKTKLVPLIRNSVLMAGGRWIEPFMGSGVVGFNMDAQHALFCDTNPYLIEFYDRMKRGTITSSRVREFLEREGRLLETGGETYYYEVRDRFNARHDPLDFLFLNRSCFNGVIRFNRGYKFNVPYGHKPHRFSKAYITKIVNQVKNLEGLFSSRDWVFQCRPFEDTIAEADPDDFIYCDPPYIGRHVDYYDSWNELSEIRLHEALLASHARFMLSTWDHNQYRSNEYLRHIWFDCNKITADHFYHVGAKEKNRRPIVEALLINYSLPSARSGWIANDG